MDLPKRKHPRLKNYDYSQNGAYHIIIHALPDVPPMSVIVAQDGDIVQKLLPNGAIVERLLRETEARFDGMTILCFSIMPTHIHILLELQNAASSITDFARVFKSTATRECNLASGQTGRKIFQTSFYEHVIRNEQDLTETTQYIEYNAEKEYYKNREI